MASPTTESGYNLFDMLSMMQKAIRRGQYNEAGFAADQLKKTYRAAMWNRLLVISSEDCFGIITKEIIRLKQENTNEAIARAVALLCRTRKSRDACYFSCNFVLASRKPREIEPDAELMNGLQGCLNTEKKPKPVYDESGFEQMTLFDYEKQEQQDDDDCCDDIRTAAILMKAIQHRDMDMAGYQIDQLRYDSRDNLWNAYQYFAEKVMPVGLGDEIKALKSADESVNAGKKNKDEIFISKAAICLLYHADTEMQDILGDEIITADKNIDWKKYRIKPIEDCRLKSKELPEWVYDCHTLKGKRMGKTDWDMTRTEQEALHPLRKAYFDDASWIYTYEQDFENGIESDEHMAPIREYAETHPANPVEFIEY